MLWFLSIAAKEGFVVKTYTDEVIGILRKNPDGKLAITSITLYPQTMFSGERQPTHSELESLHHEAHESCFIANSIKSEVKCKPQLI